jgi:hypothetical protein
MTSANDRFVISTGRNLGIGRNQPIFFCYEKFLSWRLVVLQGNHIRSRGPLHRIDWRTVGIPGLK